MGVVASGLAEAPSVLFPNASDAAHELLIGTAVAWLVALLFVMRSSRAHWRRSCILLTSLAAVATTAWTIDTAGDDQDRQVITYQQRISERVEAWGFKVTFVEARLSDTLSIDIEKGTDSAGCTLHNPQHGLRVLTLDCPGDILGNTASGGDPLAVPANQALSGGTG